MNAQVFAKTCAAGALLFAVSWLFAGLSVIGQPHVMVRFMALEEAAEMTRARAWYYLWYLIFYSLATGVGLLSRVYLADANSFDASGLLDFDTTYYWRIDEVNDANPDSPWEGPIWSFSLPPKTAYDPIPSDGYLCMSSPCRKFPGVLQQVLHDQMQ